MNNAVRNFLILGKKADISDRTNTRGIALLLVLAFVLAVVVLANIALVLVSSQARFTQHKIGRIQAFYAAQAGINYALEQLRIGNWGLGQYCIGKTGSTCVGVPGVLVVDEAFPYSVDIDIAEPVDGIRQVDAKTDYTYIY